MYCVGCGKEIPKNASYCPYCGQDLRPYLDSLKRREESILSTECAPSHEVKTVEKAPIEIRDRNSFAIVGLIFAILADLIFILLFASAIDERFFILSLPFFAIGMIFSIIGFVSTLRKKNRLPWRPLAILALTLALLPIIFYAVMIAILIICFLYALVFGF